jgi:hypothetical protein
MRRKPIVEDDSLFGDVINLIFLRRVFVRKRGDDKSILDEEQPPEALDGVERNSS